VLAVVLIILCCGGRYECTGWVHNMLTVVDMNVQGGYICFQSSPFRQICFSDTAAGAWNSFPSDVKSADTVRTFKKKLLKTLLFYKHYGYI